MPRGSRNSHLYQHGGRRAHEPEFERRYGAEHGKEVYGAVVGQVRRARMVKGLCRAGNCGLRSSHKHGENDCCGAPLHCAQILGTEQQSNNPAFGPSTMHEVLDGEGLFA